MWTKIIIVFIIILVVDKIFGNLMFYIFFCLILCIQMVLSKERKKKTNFQFLNTTIRGLPKLLQDTF